jgi:Domain of unknown function (DUF4258)
VKVKHLRGLTVRVQSKRKPSASALQNESDDLIHEAQKSLRQKAAFSSQQVISLQRLIGNQAVQRLMIQRAVSQRTPSGSIIQRVEEGKDYVHSAHSKERMKERNISQTQLERTLDNPDFVNDAGGGSSEYLSQLPSGLIMRVIVSNDTPMTIITMMKVRKHKSYK